MPKLSTQPLRKAVTEAHVKVNANAKPVPVVSAKVDELLQVRDEVAAKLDQLTGKKRVLDDAIRAEVVKHAGEGGKIETTEYVVVDCHAENVTISAERLLELGVRPKTVEDAKKRTPYAYPRITKKKAPAEPVNLATVYADLKRPKGKRKILA